jgi:hypothetical protein
MIIVYIVEQVYRTGGTNDERDFADMIVIAFFLLLRPGGYAGTASDDMSFQLQDVNLYVQGRRLGALTASDADLEAATSTLYPSPLRRMATVMKSWCKDQEETPCVALSRQPFVVVDTTGCMVQNRLHRLQHIIVALGVLPSKPRM